MPSSPVQLSNISKRFGPVQALDDVSLTLRPGRVHGVLGENGAGKTTLMNVLYGLVSPDAGRIAIDGREVSVRSPLDALALGIGMVHQHFMLAGAMTVLDNILLGDRRAPRWLDRAAAGRRIGQLAESVGLTVDLSARVENLSVGEQQRVEILKALSRDVRVLILDEPTAVLTPEEVRQLFTSVRKLRADGRSIVFISHKLGEIREICDELTVMRAGRVVFEGEAAGVSSEELARHMVGRDVEPVRLVERKEEHGLVAHATLTLTGLNAGRLHDVAFDVRPGEILGVAGVDGNGQQELAEAVVGLRSIERGRVELDGRDVTTFSAAQRFGLGIAHIPNDRKREGLVGSMSIADNLMLKAHHRPPFSRFGWLSGRAARRTALEMVDRFQIKASSVDAPVATLSGGNAQKVILARELALGDVKLVVAMNPVRGLDVGATNFVYEQLLAIRRAGGAVLLISSELDELLALCDRIGVLYAGRFTMSDFPRDGAAEQIGRLMTGATA